MQRQKIKVFMNRHAVLQDKNGQGSLGDKSNSKKLNKKSLQNNILIQKNRKINKIDNELLREMINTCMSTNAAS